MAERLSWFRLALDVRNLEVQVGDQRLPLPHKQFVVLQTLMEAQGDLVRYAEFFELIWPNHPSPGSPLRVCVSQLRSQLRQLGVQCIRNVPRVGYRLVSEPAPRPPARRYAAARRAQP